MKQVFHAYILVMTVLLVIFAEGCGGDNEPSPDRVKSVSADPRPSAVPKGMALIPAGEFQMGGHDREAEADELPVHTVYIDAFYMDRTYAFQ